LRALVIGGTGYVGSHLTRTLLKQGHAVRILARTPAKAAVLQGAGAEVRPGDLGAPASLQGIAEGIDAVFHLGSVMRGSARDFERVDIQGTERLLAESRQSGVRRFIFAGTLAGYPPYVDGSVIDEQTPLDGTGALGNYALAKARCEKLLLAAGGNPECVIVRLGLVCGSGANIFPQHVCKPLMRNWVILFGDGSVSLPLTLIDNAVAALILAATVNDISGQTFNIVDDDAITQRGYLALLRSCSGGLPHVLRLPLAAYYALGMLAEVAARARRKEPETTRYRIRCRLARVEWNCSKAKTLLHWQPRVPLREGLAAAFRAHAARDTAG
jgi:nucleoside-diphosphate-sugar epimerase